MNSAVVLEPYWGVIDKINTLASSREPIPFLFALDFEKREGLLVENPIAQSHLLFQVGGVRNAPYLPYDGVKGDLPLFRADPNRLESYEEYLERFRVVQKGILHGDSFLVNLTVKTPLESSWSLGEIYHHTRAPYKLLLPDRFLCFSPERFVQIDPAGTISTHPMKGTIDASLPDAKERILADYKETSEHHTIVDLMRNDLNQIAHNVRVERFRYIDRIVSPQREILQVSSEIKGELQEDYKKNLGSIIDALLPAGSISGAPKESTILLIREAERENRSFYTGVFGYWDGKSLDSAVMIRYIEQGEEGKLYYRSGGGITVNSNPEEEYQEVLQKIYLPL